MLKNKGGHYFMQHNELYEALGLNPKRHLPKDGFGPMVVDNVMFVCSPAGHGSKHRIRYFCEACERWIPFGRAWQHNKGKEHKLSYEVMQGRP